MDYSVTLSSVEKTLLKSLFGRTINSVIIPGTDYSIRLLCDGVPIDFTPEEYLTPEDENKMTCVTRPFVSDDGNRVRFDTIELIATDLGVIESIEVLNTIVYFSPKEPLSEWKVKNGIEIPVLYGWNTLLLHPNDSEVKKISDHKKRAIVSLDIGFLISTSSNRSLLIYTNGWSYFVHGEIDSSVPEMLEGRIQSLQLN